MAVKLLVVFVLASLVENSLARGRFLLTQHVTWLGVRCCGALAFVFYLTGHTGAMIAMENIALATLLIPFAGALIRYVHTAKSDGEVVRVQCSLY